MTIRPGAARVFIPGQSARSSHFLPPAFAAMLCGLVVLTTGRTAQAFELTGRASVVDGDTLEIHGNRIRLWGIDAPEASQLCRNEASEQYRCGAEAATRLDAFISSRPVRCVPNSNDRYGRAVALCVVDATDLGGWLVRNGLASDWPKYSKGTYAEDQLTAERKEVGLWRGSFSKPWLYRLCIISGGRPAECSDMTDPNR